ncbi:hypothetical protein [Niveibacterium sp.]|uniref:hypothetical protein n=1 Tax=Niveibacterium sp. TaxID=2017444 RepID=UPI0035AF0D6D
MSKHTQRKPLPIAKLRAVLDARRQDGSNPALRECIAKLLDRLSNVYAVIGCNVEADEQAAFVAAVDELRRLADRLRATKRGAYADGCRVLLHWSVFLDRAMNPTNSKAYSQSVEVLAFPTGSDLASFQPTETLCG